MMSGLWERLIAHPPDSAGPYTGHELIMEPTASLAEPTDHSNVLTCRVECVRRKDRQDDFGGVASER